VTRPIKCVIVPALTLWACSTATDPNYNPDIPTTWANAVNNQYFPLVPGSVYSYRLQTAGGTETSTPEVEAGTRTVKGVAATVVHDRVFTNGVLSEDTRDYYAQDGAGNVWYLGEDTKEIQNGQVVGTQGSWEWGVSGALPGIIMWSDPAAHLGKEYRQEYLKGQAEDWSKVASTGQSVTVPFGSFTGCVTTEEWNALKPNEPHALKSFCPGLGLALKVDVGSSAREELTNRTTP